MNNKLSYYFSKGNAEASFAYRKLNFKTKFSLMIYFFISFVGKLFLFTRPVFAMADQNIGKMISETRELSLSQAFHGIGDSKKYLSLLGTYFVKDITLAIIFVLSLLPYLMYRTLASYWSLDEDMLTFLLILGIVFDVVAFVVSNVKYVGAPYVSAFLSKPETSDVLHICKTEMDGKRSRILAQIAVQFLICAPTAIILIVGTAHLYDQGDEIIWPILGLLLYIIWLVMTLFVFTPRRLNGLVQRYEIYSDSISLKKPILIKEVAGSEEAYAALFGEDERELQALSVSNINKKEGR